MGEPFSALLGVVTLENLMAIVANLVDRAKQGVVFSVGSSGHFQAWFQEAFSFNTSDGIGGTFR
jgi:hypothetical protein